MENEGCSRQPGSLGHFTRRFCRGEVTSFPQGPNVHNWLSRLLQNSRRGLCFAKIVYALLMCQEPGMQSGADAIPCFTSLQPTCTHCPGLKLDSRYRWKVCRLPGFQEVPLLLFSQGAKLISQVHGNSFFKMGSVDILIL